MRVCDTAFLAKCIPNAKAIFVTHTIRQIEIPGLLDSWVTDTKLCVHKKIACPYVCVTRQVVLRRVRVTIFAVEKQ